MMKNLLLLTTTIVLFSLSINAQNAPSHPCGAIDYRSPWLKKYQANPDAFPKSNNVLYVPLKIHITGSNGLGFYSLDRLYDSMCALNDQFEGTDLYFYIDGEINFIDNGDYHRHETIQEGAEMMFTYNVPNALNCYIVSDPAGNCGYNLPYAGVALKTSCIDNEIESTWAHEIGHAFSLPHPFLGWEGGQTHDNSTPPNFSQAAPEYVTYDYTYFQDFYIDFDTLIIDTALVEKMDGSNCADAADGFCDTAPDYLANRWDCDGNGISTQTQRDPNNNTFKSDGSLYMSYANDACAQRFTAEQIGAMRASLLDETPELVNENFVVQEVGAVQLFEPILDAIVPPNNAFFQWDEADNAEAYLLQVSRLSNFSGGGSTITQTALVEGTNFTFDNLDDGRTYYWRVRPINSGYFCTTFSDAIKFETGEATGLDKIASVENFEIIPSLATSNTDVILQLNTLKQIDLELEIVNLAGEILLKQQVQTSNKTSYIPLNINQLTSGIYFINIKNNDGQLTKKMIVQ